MLQTSCSWDEHVFGHLFCVLICVNTYFFILHLMGNVQLWFTAIFVNTHLLLNTKSRFARVCLTPKCVNIEHLFSLISAVNGQILNRSVFVYHLDLHCNLFLLIVLILRTTINTIRMINHHQTSSSTIIIITLFVVVIMSIITIIIVITIMILVDIISCSRRIITITDILC